MRNDLGVKLIAVLDINSLKLYKAQGLKIIDEVGCFLIHSDVNHKTEKHEGFKGQKSTPSSFYDPHSSAKDIEYRESSKVAINHIKKIFASDREYKELFVVAEAKMLGHLRQYLTSGLKKCLNKEIKKDLIHHKMKDVEKAVFA
ncbi:MAG: hypothetical protein COA94_06525 [Rickettsiales bacterium]|nr:MAG: hypothetical protein COA94_06525 [Rickettsiales bacterium]